MASTIDGIFIYVSDNDIEDFIENKENYEDKVAFLGNSKKIVAKGKEYGGDHGNSKIFYGTCDTAAATTEKAVICTDFTENDLVDGVMVIVKFDNTNSGAVADIALNVNETGAYNIKKIYGTNTSNPGIKDLYSVAELYADAPIPFIFNGTYWIIAGVDMNANTTYTINYSLDAGQYKAGNGSQAVSKYVLLLQKADETWEKPTDTSKTYSTGTTKTVNTNGFLLNQIRYYNASTVVANGALIKTNVCQSKAASVDMRYSTNCGNAPGWEAGDYIYLVGSIGLDGLFYLDTTTWWSNVLPSTNDGKLYIRLGLALANATTPTATYCISFFDDRPIFYHDGTKICQYLQADNKQDTISDLATIRSNAEAGAAKVSNVQSDWNASSGLAEVLNKPDMNDYVSKEELNTQSYLTAHQDIKTLNGNSLIGTGNIEIKENVKSDWLENNSNASSYVFNKPKINGVLLQNDINSIELGLPIFVKQREINMESFIAGGDFDINGQDWLDGKFYNHLLINFKDNVLFSIVGNKQNSTRYGFLNERDFNSLELTPKITDGLYSIGPGELKYIYANGYYGLYVSHSTGNKPQSITGYFSIIPETDPVFAGSPAYAITSTNISNWNTYQANTIETISVNSSPVTPVSKNVNIVIPTLSKGTTSGNGNAVTDISVSAHEITLTKGSTFLTDHQSIKSLNNVSLSGSTDNITLTIVKEQTPETGFLATYKLKQGDTQIGASINIPKDYLIKSGEVKTVTTANTPYTGAAVGDKYLDFTVNVQEGTASDTHMYIPVNDLVDVYTEGNGIDISNSNVVSIQIDSTNANGLATTSSGLKLGLASGSSAGAMSSSDFTKLSGIPSISSANNGQILQVVNGAWTLVTPVAVYTGSESPNNNNGNNGDIYLQS